MNRTALKLLPIITLLLLTSFAAVTADDGSDASSVSTLTLEVNGGTGTTQEWKVETGNTIELPVQIFTRSGYCLSGWNTSPGGTGTEYTTSIQVDENITLYAQWDPLPVDGRYVIQDTQAPAVATGPYTYTPVVNGNASQDCWTVFPVVASSGYGWGLDSKPDWLNVIYENGTLTFSGTPTDSG